ncbi:MAG: hypothetical protein ACOCQ1_04460 [Halanaerobiaceae bacterium]
MLKKLFAINDKKTSSQRDGSMTLNEYKRNQEEKITKANSFSLYYH